MVGRIFRVIFSSKSRRRQQQIFDFEQKSAGTKHARRVQREIAKAARKLENLPESKPLLPDTEDEEKEYRYAKAFSYKIIFTVLKKVGEVFIITVRHDAEDPDDVRSDL